MERLRRNNRVLDEAAGLELNSSIERAHSDQALLQADGTGSSQDLSSPTASPKQGKSVRHSSLSVTVDAGTAEEAAPAAEAQEEDANAARRAELLESLPDWLPPSKKKAKVAFARAHYHHELFDLRETAAADLAEFGQGVALYFFFLKYAAVLMALLSVAALPNMVWCAMGQSQSSQTASLDATTLGAFGPLFGAEYVYNGSHAAQVLGSAGVDLPNVRIAQELELEFYYQNASSTNATMAIKPFGSHPKRYVNYVMSYLDLAGTLLYLLVAALLLVFQRRELRAVAERTVTISDYSLQVWMLPKDADAEELQAHFSQWGAVHAVIVAHNDCSLIDTAMARGAAQEARGLALAAAQREVHLGRDPTGALDKVIELDARLHELNEAVDTQQEAKAADSVCAFVTFKMEEGRARCMRANPSSTGRRLFLRKDRCFRKRYALHVSEAPEPDDILWENLEFTLLQRLQLRAVVTIAVYFIILIGFGLVNFAASLRSSNTGITSVPPQCATACVLLDANSALNLTTSSALAIRYKQCSDSDSWQGVACTSTEQQCYQCYCKLAAVGFQSFDYCLPYWPKYVIQAATQGAAVVVTLVTNQALYWFSFLTNNYERHHTATAAKRSLASKLFVAQFVNTALSTIVANVYLPALYRHVGQPLSPWLFQGVFSDLVPTWYAQVGRGLIITLLLMAVLLPCAVLQRYVLYRYYSRDSRKDAAVTQEQLNAVYTGPSFVDVLPDRYAATLNLVFCTMMFSAGLPILYPITALGLTASYWAEKWDVLKLSRVPAQTTGALAELAGQVLPYAALWHLIFGAWAFSWFKLWPPPSNSVADSSFGTFVQAVGDALNSILFDSDPTRHLGARLVQDNAVAHTVTFIVMVLLLILRTLAALGTYVAQQAFSVIGMDSSYLGPKVYGLPSFAIAVRSRLLVGPTSYAMTANARYCKAFGLDAEGGDDAGQASSQRKRRKHKRKPKVKQKALEEPESLPVDSAFVAKDVLL